jgi:excinuclease ABC subunit A
VTEEAGGHEKLFKQLVRQGFSKVRVDGALRDIEEIGTLNKKARHTIDVVVDRLIIKQGLQNRLADSLELTLSQSGGRAMIDVAGRESFQFSEKAACVACGVSYPPFSPASFSFNSPHGACPRCNGLGSTTAVDPDLVIPNPELSLREGAVTLWAKRDSFHFIEFLDALTSAYGTDIYTPYKLLPEQFRHALLHGSKDIPIKFHIERNERRIFYARPFEGIIPKLERRYKETDSAGAREEIRQYMSFQPCSECKGARLNAAALSVRIQGRNLSELASLSIGDALGYFKELIFSGHQHVISERILKEVVERLGFLNHVGLSYLTLDRSANTLSGGESQRIRLATQIGSKLTGVLYVLDEPSVGLHQRDNHRLLSALKQMRDLGNTVLVVEHDEDTIRSADYVVDMGPGAGILGGEVVFSGTPQDLVQESRSLTGQYLSGKKKIEVPLRRRNGNGSRLSLSGLPGTISNTSARRFPWDVWSASRECRAPESPHWYWKPFTARWFSAFTIPEHPPVLTAVWRGWRRSTKWSISISRPSDEPPGPIPPPIPAYSRTSAICFQKHRMPGSGGLGQAASVLMSRAGGARPVAGAVSSGSKCIFCPMFMSPAMCAGESATTGRPWKFAIGENISPMF